MNILFSPRNMFFRVSSAKSFQTNLAHLPASLFLSKLSRTHTPTAVSLTDQPSLAKAGKFPAIQARFCRSLSAWPPIYRNVRTMHANRLQIILELGALRPLALVEGLCFRSPQGEEDHSVSTSLCAESPTAVNEPFPILRLFYNVVSDLLSEQ